MGFSCSFSALLSVKAVGTQSVEERHTLESKKFAWEKELVRGSSELGRLQCRRHSTPISVPIAIELKRHLREIWFQFGKRDGYRPLQFGKRDYRPLQFGKRSPLLSAYLVPAL
uniref:Neuropeptide-like protein 12 n=1 Tax=Trichostrongylus colubriformis TaxID=6319 RepID=Q3LRU3_TRICO|nr:neuropeptide-like protein 12 [Trichostrongylus colubriformis]